MSDQPLGKTSALKENLDERKAHLLSRPFFARKTGPRLSRDRVHRLVA